MASTRKVAIILLSTFMLIIFLQLPATANYKRIVSLYPGHTDNIIALGASSKLVGISKSSDTDQLPGIPRFSLNTGAEEILALHPDLVIIRTLIEQQNPELRKILERTGVKVMLIDPPSWNDFGKYLQELAPLIGSDPKKATDKLESLRNQIKSEAARYSSKKAPVVFVEATEREIHTCSPNSWAANLLQLAGGINSAKEAKPLRKGSNIATWGLEKTLKSVSTGLDIYIIQQGAMNGSDLNKFNKRPWSPVLKKVKVATMPESFLSRPSLLGLDSGGKIIIEILYGKPIR